MRVLLTGATGFIGRHVFRRLVEEGHDVAALVRPNSRLDVLQPANSRVHLLVYDGTYSSLHAAVAATRPNLVIHLASLFLSHHSALDVARLIESNLNFPTQLLEAMAEFDVKHLINTGTSWQHFEGKNYNPVNLYAATKQAFETLLSFYVEAKGIRAITLKLFDTYGPNDDRVKLFSLLRGAAKTGEALRMSPGEQVLDLVYIDDVVDAFLLSMAHLPLVTTTESYAVSGPDRISLRELVRVYENTVGRRVPVEWGERSYRPREVMMPWKAHDLVPGWQARVPLIDGIKYMEKDGQIGGLLAESAI